MLWSTSYEHRTTVTTKITCSRLEPLTINRRIRTLAAMLMSYVFTVVESVDLTWTKPRWRSLPDSARFVLTPTGRRRGSNEWRTSRFSSGPVIGIFPIGITNRPGQKTNNSIKKKTNKKVKTVMADGVSTLGTRHITKTLRYHLA